MLEQQPHLVAFANANRGGRPFPDAIDGDDGRLFVGRRKEGTRRVRVMVLGQMKVFGGIIA